MRKLTTAAAVLAATLATPAAIAQEADAIDAGFRDVIGLEGIGAPRISPDGSLVAYSVNSTEWDANRFDSEIWITGPGVEPYQLTRTESGSSGSHAWHPDGAYLAFAANRSGSRQIYTIRPMGGEAIQLTDIAGGLGGFAFSPDGAWIAYSATDEQSDESKARAELYGGYAVEDAEFRMTHLWVIGADGKGEPRRLTEGDFTVGSFRWSPDGARIVFDHRPTPQVNSFPQADISWVDVASGDRTALVTDAGPDSGPSWSPDGSTVLYSTNAGANPYYGNNEYALVPADGGESRVITASFDENPGLVEWREEGIWFTASQRTRRALFLLDPASGAVTEKLASPEMIWGVDFSDDGRVVVVEAASRDTLDELFVGSPADFDLEQLTNTTAQVEDWDLGSREVIQWTSEDGAEVEGVLYKPDNFDSSARHPLMVVIHGGPTGTSRPSLVSGYVYPVTQWLQKGAMVLMPNYRGSAGYGADFRALNVRNLGVGDAWDVMSGVQHLVDEGIADPDRLGSMGWSQGGYISAFLTTNTDMFEAISVGAGISNWMTYYVNTDIHGFTQQYLESTPWSDPEIYAVTSPMTNINDAVTPTLIQHGEFDARVPTPNAYELYQGLQDVGAETELVIYKGFGHGITKPKERLVAMWHNWMWFGRHVWGEEWELPVDARDGDDSMDTNNRAR
ncbi:MAG: prolyl oligopeptidase family serine peptidase [Acidobacteria bacterium]|nr:prolyl oligopeptidase family serine peptidase [Acidobacteriota bacterium]